ncbi:hypothetical protein [Actinoplanes sp. NBRC 103695]|uniref:hypothetical protein n=1 Tax=Actinoplanes sp. NBRC 103695 TaxID=3032202 RepID=UPI0025574DEB|nr:hypothetical protein [Actinoplanes sp. NBRC 103695]
MIFFDVRTEDVFSTMKEDLSPMVKFVGIVACMSYSMVMTFASGPASAIAHLLQLA